MEPNEKLMDNITGEINDALTTIDEELAIPEIDLKMLQANKASLESLVDDEAWGPTAKNLIAKIGYILEFESNK
jgi:hypothetical protein